MHNRPSGHPPGSHAQMIHGIMVKLGTLAKSMVRYSARRISEMALNIHFEQLYVKNGQYYTADQNLNPGAQ